MAEWIGYNRKARRTYGFDEIALVPGEVTYNPDEVDTSWELGGKRFDIPFIASAMDGVVDTQFAIAMGKFGGFALAFFPSGVVAPASSAGSSRPV